MSTLSCPDGTEISGAAPHARAFYHVGGTVPRDSGCYVTRAADRDLLEALRRGEFCYVLTARQMGKSSLMTRAAVRLREEGAAVAVVDLTAFGRNVSPEQWYDLIQSRIGRELGLEEELDAFWLEHERLPPLARFMASLEQVLLRRVPGRVVLFIDEIDVVRSLPFDTDELFAAIREFYTRRAREPELGRLSFCLLGVASPADLIADARITPFNIGRRIELRDFTAEEALPLALGLAPAHPHTHTPTHPPQRPTANPQRLLSRILYWTGGHPYLTQRVCQAVSEGMNGKTGSNHPSSLIPHPSEVDAACARLFFDSRAAEAEDNLRFVADRLLRSGNDVASVLDLYAHAAHPRGVADDETDPLISSLRLSGVVRAEGGRLRVRNRIYCRVFDRSWIERQRDPADLRRQRRAYRQGRNRALALGGVIAVVMGALAAYAFGQASRADRERRAFQRAADDADLASYAASLNLLQREFEIPQYAHVASLLRDTRDSHHRGWEWGYWQRRMHQEARQLVGHASQVRGASWSPDGRRIVTLSVDGTARVWQAASGRQVAVLDGHGGVVLAAAWSPDGRHVVTASEDGTARVWDPGAPGRPLALLRGHEGAVYDAAWSPDGQQIATASNDHTVRVWDAASGRQTAMLSGHTRSVRTVAWCRDGRRLLTTGDEEDSSARVWNLAAPAAAALVFQHAAWVRAACWSPDGRRVLTASGERAARIWDAVTGRELGELGGGGGAVVAAAWSPDGRRILTVSGEHSIRVWNAGSGRLSADLKPVQGAVRTAAWSPDGRRIAAALDDSTTRVWDSGSGVELAVLKHADLVRTVAWSPDGRRVVTTGDEEVARVWETAPRSDWVMLGTAAKPVLSAVWSPDGRRVLTTGDRRTARIWDTAGRELVALGRAASPVLAAAWSPDGRWIATVGRGHRGAVWDAASGRELATLSGRAPGFRLAAPRMDAASGRGLVSPQAGSRRGSAGLAHTPYFSQLQHWLQRSREPGAMAERTPGLPTVEWSPDGQRILTAGCDDTARIWDPVSGKELMELKVYRGRVSAAAWSPDGTQVVLTSGEDVTARVWQVAPGGSTSVLNAGGAGFLWALAWSPDGRRIAAPVAGDHSPRVWQQPSGRTTVIIDGRTRSVLLTGWAMLATLRGHAELVRMVSWSPDGKKIVTASDDHTGALWDAATGKRLWELKGHSGAVFAAAWSPDGLRVVTASDDHTARLWDVASGRELTALKEHGGAVLTAAWSPDGRRVLTTCEDGRARVWTSDPGGEMKGTLGHGAALR